MIPKENRSIHLSADFQISKIEGHFESRSECMEASALSVLSVCSVLLKAFMKKHDRG